MPLFTVEKLLGKAGAEAYWAKHASRRLKVFLAGTVDEDWRDELFAEMGDLCDLIDPTKPDYNPESDIYVELGELLTADLIVFFKPGPQSLR